MLMDPDLVWATHLCIDEFTGRIPGRDLRLPTKRDAMDSQSIIDQRSGTHFNRARSENHEVQPGRRDGLKIARVRKEVEYNFDRLRQPLLSFKFQQRHTIVRP